MAAVEANKAYLSAAADDLVILLASHVEELLICRNGGWFLI